MSLSLYKSYPNLTQEEFAETCHYLDRRYSRAILGPLRKQWQLTVHTGLDSSNTNSLGFVTYLQISRPLVHQDAAGDDLAAQLGTFTLDGQNREDETMVELENSDSEALTRPSTQSRWPGGYVSYEIHLHPTYQVPCLWFTLHNLPPYERAFDFDTVFRRLVPDEYKSSLRGLGSVGGISADNHPLTGIPSFFVHPCLVGDSMADFNCAKDDYLMIWLGLVGSCVGLWVPKEMAMVQGDA